jgi:hypothetical protein
MVDVTELIGVGMDVDESLAGVVRSDERVAVGRRLSKASTDCKDQVCLADALLELWVWPVAELAGIDPALIVDCVLAAECRGDGNAVAEGEIAEVVSRARAPVGAADNCDR